MESIYSRLTVHVHFSCSLQVATYPQAGSQHTEKQMLCFYCFKMVFAWFLKPPCRHSTPNIISCHETAFLSVGDGVCAILCAVKCHLQVAALPLAEAAHRERNFWGKGVPSDGEQIEVKATVVEAKHEGRDSSLEADGLRRKLQRESEAPHERVTCLSIVLPLFWIEYLVFASFFQLPGSCC